MVDTVPKWASMVSRLHGLGLMSVAAYEHGRVGAPSVAFCRRMRRVERRANGRAMGRVARLARQLRLTIARFGYRGATDDIMEAWSRIWSNKRQWVAVDDSRLHDDDRKVEFLLDIIERSLADLRAGKTGR